MTVATLNPKLEVVRPHTAVKTLLFSDLVGSTQMATDLGDAEAYQMIQRHDRIARDLLPRFSGHEMNKTDGFLFAFERPFDALMYSISYHQGLEDLVSQTGVPLKCRVGIHFGEVFVQENLPEDIARGAKPVILEGLGVAMASRIMSLAQGSQTLLTQSAYEVVKHHRSDSDLNHLRWLEHGFYLFKGVGEPVAVFEVGAEGVALMQSPPETEKVRKVGAGLPAVLVLPFDHVSAEKDDFEYFSDGLTDEIITDLSFVDTIRVIARTAAMQLKGSDKSIELIRSELGVEYILEGSVRTAGKQMRITVKLIDATTSKLMWADKYTASIDDVFEIQEKISRQVVDALKLTLTPQEDKKLGARRIPDAEAYRYYLRARQEIFRFSQEALDRAMDYLNKAEEIVGDNIYLQSAKGYIYWQLVNIGLSSDLTNLDHALVCADKILELDADAPDGHRLLGLISIYEGNVQQVITHLKRALERDGNDTDALFWLILMYGLAGKSHMAPPLLKQLIRIDSLTPLHHFLSAWVPFTQGAFAEAIPLVQEAYVMEPENPVMEFGCGLILAMGGKIDAACAIFTCRSEDDDFFAQFGKVYAYALRGEGELAIEAITEDLIGFATDDPEWAWHMAQCYSLSGDPEQSLQWLKNAVDQGMINYPMLAELDPLLENLRSHVGFEPLMGRVRRQWRSFEV